MEAGRLGQGALDSLSMTLAACSACLSVCRRVPPSPCPSLSPTHIAALCFHCCRPPPQVAVDRLSKQLEGYRGSGTPGERGHKWLPGPALCVHPTQ